MPQIEIDTRYIENVGELLKGYPKETSRAMANALNRTIDKTITYIHDEVSKEYTIKRTGVKKSLSIKKAKTSHLEAQAISKGSRLKISNFPFSSSGKYRIAKVKIKRGAKLSKSNPPLFVGKANKTTGKREVFKRTPNTPYKIGFGLTLAIPQMVANPDIFDHISYKSNLFFAERFEHELWYQFEKMKGGL